MSLLLDDFRMAMASIKPYIKKTPLIRCKELEKELNTPYQIFLKLESEQLTKSFKIRGAFNALLALEASEKAKGIITRSSGIVCIVSGAMRSCRRHTTCVKAKCYQSK